MPIEGLDAIKRKMRAIPDKAAYNASRRALRKGANVIRDKARAGAARVNDPATPENIAKNIVAQAGAKKYDRRRGGPAFRIGVLGGARDMSKYGEIKGAGKKNPGGDTFYWRFLEFGTSKMGAQPFMRPAMNQGADAAFSATVTAMDVEFSKELSKL